MKSYEQQCAEHLKDISKQLERTNKSLQKTCEQLSILCDKENETASQLLFLRNELYSYYRKTHPEDKEMNEES